MANDLHDNTSPIELINCFMAGEADTTRPDQPKGQPIGGFLRVVLLALLGIIYHVIDGVYVPIVRAFFTMQRVLDNPEQFSPSIFELMRNNQPFIKVQLLSTSVLLLGLFFALYLFVRKKTLFIRWYVLMLISTVGVLLLCSKMETLMVHDLELLNMHTIRLLLFPLLSLVVTSEYMRFSARVRATFVH